MNSESIFLDWAGDSIWSRWVKPVLFAHLSDLVIARAITETQHLPTADVGNVSRATGTTAILVDLPGVASMETGLALAELGYRPVPLYNSVPAMLTDLSPRSMDGESLPRTAAIDMYPIVRLLVQATRDRTLTLPSPHAAPAFLLDSRRRGSGATPRPGDFDNRSISLPTDFPSANFMLANGIREALVIQEQEGPPQQDLAHTLRRWQDAGIRIETATPGATPQPVVVGRPPRFRHMWYGLLARMGLRQNPLGGYGGFLPVPSAG
jgi:hypothetical protein